VVPKGTEVVVCTVVKSSEVGIWKGSGHVENVHIIHGHDCAKILALSTTK